MKKVILDIDTGIDDALAITYLLSCKDVEVVGLTTTFGNVTNDTAYHNTLRLVRLLGRKDIPVLKGASHALNNPIFEMKPRKYVVHGLNGIGNAELPEVQEEVYPMLAQDFMIDCCDKYGEDLIIIQVGAMTNLAIAFQKNPDAIRKAGKIVFMGGALTVPGNVTKFAEANFYADPEAAKILMESELPITMVGLDVTHQTVIREENIALWKTIAHPAAQGLYQMCQYYYNNEGDSTTPMVGCLHDPLAVEVAIHPEVVTFNYACDLTVETEGPSTGRSIGDKKKILSGNRTTNVPLRVKSQQFVEKFSEAIYQYLLTL